MNSQEKIKQWYKHKKWKPQVFQQEVMDSYLEGKNGILNAPTGTGKTYALWLPILADWMEKHPDYKTLKSNGLQVIWVAPLRALAKDITLALQKACDELDIPWSVQRRTGDTSFTQKQKQKTDTPECLVTTPESLHIFFAQKNYPQVFKGLTVVVVDEWHELLGTKRGVQTELAISRLQALNPNLRVWGVSATIGNLEQAKEVLLGEENNKNSIIVKANIKKEIIVETILPTTVERFSWAGHLGVDLIKKTIPIIEKSQTTLLFTNVRSQAEIWFHRYIDEYPDLAMNMAIHHGSMDKEVREKVEEFLHEHKLKAVVCTSSLDLGVDFRPVDTVIQIGSPKGVARFLQRAGRSGHRPEENSHIYFLPTNSLEILESAAIQQAIKEGKVEERVPMENSFDVLVQYLLTLAVSEGFREEELFEEVKKTYAYRNMKREDWEWLLLFLTKGGRSLSGYSEYKKIIEKDGLYTVQDKTIASRHRMSIGTITSDEIMQVKMLSGRSIGSIEESFISMLKPGDSFWFAGRPLRFVRVRDMIAFVDKSSAKKAVTPRWMGGRISLTSYVADLLRQQLDKAHDGIFDSPEMKALKPLLDLQAKRSHLPAKDEFLIESMKSRDGHHLFFYPFEGRLVHEGISALFAHRIAQKIPVSFSIAMNDYGFELLSDKYIDLDRYLNAELFDTTNLAKDIYDSVNSTEMARRKFRDISKISGLVFQGYPGKHKKSRHLQSSAEIFFDIFTKYEPDNLLVKQAYNEALTQQLDQDRIRNVLQALEKKRIMVTPIEKPSPFAFPILVDRLRQKLTSEELSARLERMKLKLED